MRKQKVIIIGGGFGGLSAAKKIKNPNIEVTLIDKTNHHLFQPLLYQVATAALSPADIAAPIRGILRNRKNIRVIMGNVERIDVENKKVFLDNEILEYDYLIVAVGSRHSYFGNDAWEKDAPGLKTLSDALKIREKILLSYEKAERSNDENDIKKYLTFAVIGGGPTGVELAGAISEIAHKTLMKDFRKIDPAKAKVILIEAANRILSTYENSLSEKAKSSLESLGVTVLLNKKVTNISGDKINLGDETIEAANIIWAAGNTIPAIIKSLNSETDRAGRVLVLPDCSIKNHPEVFVIGDAALFIENNKPLPGIAPVAIQQGKYIGKILNSQIEFSKRKPFKYFDKGTLATIGRARAVMQIGKFKISGFIAWSAWVFIHIMYLIGFRNRYKVLAEWMWYYISYKHGIRLITHENDL